MIVSGHLSYVYMFLDEHDNPYYIGKGCRYRTNHDDKRKREVPTPKDKAKIKNESSSIMASNKRYSNKRFNDKL